MGDSPCIFTTNQKLLLKTNKYFNKKQVFFNRRDGRQQKLKQTNKNYSVTKEGGDIIV